MLIIDNQSKSMQRDEGVNGKEGHAYSKLGYSKRQYNEKGLQRTILDFDYIQYFMIIVNWCMTITRMMSC